VNSCSEIDRPCSISTSRQSLECPVLDRPILSPWQIQSSTKARPSESSSPLFNLNHHITAMYTPKHVLFWIYFSQLCFNLPPPHQPPCRTYCECSTSYSSSPANESHLSSSHTMWKKMERRWRWSGGCWMGHMRTRTKM
jgi:hypothetical protein